MDVTPTPVVHGHHEENFPWKHIIGFVLSLILTGAALWIVLSLHLPAAAVITAIMVLAIAQVLLQLLLFMHMTERQGPAYHVLMIVYGFFIAISVVGGSIWIVSFSNGVS